MVNRCLFILFFKVVLLFSQSSIPRDTTKDSELREKLSIVNKQIQANPTDCKNYYKRSAIYLKLQELIKAKQDLDKTIELCPDDSFTYYFYYQRASILDKLKLDDQAYQDFTKCIELKPDFAGVYLDRGVFLSNRRMYFIGGKDIDKAIELKPNWGDALAAKAMNLEWNGYTEDAIVYYLKAIKEKKSTDRFILICYNNLGVICNKKGVYEEAIKYFDTALNLAPKYTFALTNRAEAKFRLNDKLGACSDLQKAISLGRKDLKKAYQQYCN